MRIKGDIPKDQVLDWTIMIATAIVFYILLAPLLGALLAQYHRDQLQDAITSSSQLTLSQAEQKTIDYINQTYSRLDSTDQMLAAMIRACEIKKTP